MKWILAWPSQPRRIGRRRSAASCHHSRPGILPWVAWIIASGCMVAFRFRAETGQPSVWAANFWLAALAWTLLAAWMLGWWILRHPWGAWINARNVTSLSRFQGGAWFILLGSVVVATLCLNVLGESDVELDDSALLQGTVAVGGLAGTGAILSRQRRIPVTPEAIEAGGRALVQDEAEAYLEDVLEAIETRPRDGYDEDATAELPADLVRVLDALSPDVAARGREISKDERLPRHLLGATRFDATASFLHSALLDAEREGVSRHDLARALFAEFEGRSVTRKTRKARKAVHAALAAIPRKSRLDIEDLLPAQAARDLGQDGVLFSNPRVCDARLRDMVQGDQIASATKFSVAKMQFLGLTLLSMIAFGVATWRMFALDGVQGAVNHPDGISELVALSGVGYLGGKLPVLGSALKATPVEV